MGLTHGLHCTTQGLTKGKETPCGTQTDSPHSACTSSPGKVKCKHVGDALGFKQGHQQAIHAHGHAGAFGQAAGKSEQKRAIHRYRRKATCIAYTRVSIKARALLGGIAELVIAVGQLQRAQVQLEALGQRRLAGADLDYDLDGALLRDEAVYLKKLHSEYLVCDDLKIGNIEPISKEVLNNIEITQNKKIVYGTFGTFSINDLPKQLREKINEH